MNKGMIWDVVVIGGGPSGMMAAGRAAERGLSVLLLEKNDTLGKKLLITGGGRCNVTNGELDTRKLLSKFKESDKFLFSAFSKWSVRETLDFFHQRNMDTKEENEKRIFPVSNKAQSVFDVLYQYLRENKVTIQSHTTVTGLSTNKNTVTAIHIKGDTNIQARNVILATGGKSHPETGSTGEGFQWLKEIGHTVTEPTPSLVPIEIHDAWVKKMQGISIPDVKISIVQNNIKQETKQGKILFTHFGVTGPTILNMSEEVKELLKYGDVYLSLDLLPSFDHGQLNTKLQETIYNNAKKKIKNALTELIPTGIVPIVLERSQIPEDTFCHSLSREERLSLITHIKNLTMHVQGVLGEDKAIVTSGGVSLTEIDFKTMQSKLFPNLYLIGDILDIDRPSGGYSLQLCWTTGFVAGDSIQP